MDAYITAFVLTWFSEYYIYISICLSGSRRGSWWWYEGGIAGGEVLKRITTSAPFFFLFFEREIKWLSQNWKLGERKSERRGVCWICSSAGDIQLYIEIYIFIYLYRKWPTRDVLLLHDTIFTLRIETIFLRQLDIFPSSPFRCIPKYDGCFSKSPCKSVRVQKSEEMGRREIEAVLPFSSRCFGLR